jgi:hypothetical protein
MLSQVESLEAYFVTNNWVPAAGSVPTTPTDATPAESYPLFLRMVSPSSRNPTASSPPTTPTIPQFSEGTDVTARAAPDREDRRGEDRRRILVHSMW